ncbi:hypothetical protein AVEN_233635-1 [Araneus ventricosus]|uniref:Uncharacterized protein n=1 Tax=Araneus ventricosus TaxID=182803 RepID=A0A4Y2VRG4_ARAVE|nr:hypothetical protein AVEN_233635-1 [Araneus ventricosus]
MVHVKRIESQKFTLWCKAQIRRGGEESHVILGIWLRFKITRVPTKVHYHPFNYRMAAAIFIRVVSRHGKVTMRYWMKPLTAPPGGKRWS